MGWYVAWRKRHRHRSRVIACSHNAYNSPASTRRLPNTARGCHRNSPVPTAQLPPPYRSALRGCYRRQGRCGRRLGAVAASLDASLSTERRADAGISVTSMTRETYQTAWQAFMADLQRRHLCAIYRPLTYTVARDMACCLTRSTPPPAARGDISLGGMAPRTWRPQVGTGRRK